MAVRSVNDMVVAAKAKIENISPHEAERRVAKVGAMIVDIRDVRELQRAGAIPGSIHAPRGMLEFWVSPDSPYTKESFLADREFILCCAGGGRSALATLALQDMGLERVSHIESGFAGWNDAGLSVTDYATWKADAS